MGSGTIRSRERWVLALQARPGAHLCHTPACWGLARWEAQPGCQGPLWKMRRPRGGTGLLWKACLPLRGGRQERASARGSQSQAHSAPSPSPCRPDPARACARARSLPPEGGTWLAKVVPAPGLLALLQSCGDVYTQAVRNEGAVPPSGPLAASKPGQPPRSALREGRQPGFAGGPDRAV